MQRAELDAYLERYLDVATFRDYCPNGLQVEGTAYVDSIVTGVTASIDLLTAAAERGAHAVLVHHGYFWRGENPRIIGPRRRRIAVLIEKNINLYAFHLPLDAHPEIGNNVTLARHLDLHIDGRCGEQQLVFFGHADTELTLAALAGRIEQRLDRAPLVIGAPQRSVNRIAWCTGAAQRYLEDAIGVGADVYVTGEVSEQTVLLARESDVAFIAAGHHATERYGIAALGAHLSTRFALRHTHIDIPNPA